MTLATRNVFYTRRSFSRTFHTALAATQDTEGEEGGLSSLSSLSSLDLDKEEMVIFRGSDGDEIDGAVWENIETGQPPQWLVMKEVREYCVDVVWMQMSYCPMLTCYLSPVHG